MRVAMMGAALVLAGALAGGTAAAPVTRAACAKGKVVKVVKGKRVCVARAPALAPSKRGHYSGATTQNAALSFDVAVVSGKVVLRGITVTELDEACDPGGGVIAFSVAFGPFALHPDAKGHVRTSVGFDRGNAGRGTFALDATVTASGHASGTLTDTESLNANGVTYACSTGALTWTAGTGAAAVALAPRAQPGHYHGTTSQGASIDFDLVSSGGILYAQGLSIVEIDETCSPGQVSIALYNVSFGTSSMLVDGHGRLHFVFTQLPASSLDPSARTFALDATFDGAGHVFGTLGHHQVVAQDTGALTCDTGQVTWNAVGQ